MERRDFLKIAVGVAAGGVALAATAQAAPLMPQALDHSSAPEGNGRPLQPAVTTSEEVNQLQPEEVRWHRWHHRIAARLDCQQRIAEELPC